MPTSVSACRRRPTALRRALGPALLSALLAACERPVDLLRLEIASSFVVLTTDSSGQELTSRATFSDGTSDWVSSDWVSSAPTIARIAPCASYPAHTCLTGVSAGEAVITATYQGQSASANVTVR